MIWNNLALSSSTISRSHKFYNTVFIDPNGLESQKEDANSASNPTNNLAVRLWSN